MLTEKTKQITKSDDAENKTLITTADSNQNIYEGCSINKLQNSIILLVFQI